jgi:hypothetical protein
MGLINDPIQALENARNKTPFLDKIKQRLESIIDNKIREVENMSLTQSRRIVDDLEKLVKIYLLLSGEATERKENVNRSQHAMQVQVLIEELKKRGDQQALPPLDDVVDVAFDVLDEEENLDG